jgi:hypothetical protein
MLLLLLLLRKNLRRCLRKARDLGNDRGYRVAAERSPKDAIT